MAQYTPTYTKPYPDGYVDAPPKQTPVTAAIMDAYDSAVENIETYLGNNPIEKAGTAIDGSVADTVLTIELKDSDGTVISSKQITLPSGGGGSDVDLTVGNSISLGREANSDIGIKSVATGTYVVASGNYSNAENNNTQALGEGSHSEGYNTAAWGDYQHVQGKWNKDDFDNIYAHIVGGGTSDSDKKNIHTLDWNGNAYYGGTLESAGLILTDAADSTKRYLVQVTNGALTATEITA